MNPNDFPEKPRGPRRFKSKAFLVLCLSAASTAILILAVLLTSILVGGIGGLDLSFLQGIASKDPEKAGIYAAMIGSIFVLFICAITAIPLGVGTAILLEEYRPKNAFLRRLHGIVQTNITNLAGVPSIVYGILGLTAFAQMFGVFGSVNDPALAGGVQNFHVYQGVTGAVYYMPVDSDETELKPAFDGMEVFTSKAMERKRTLEAVSRAEYEPLQDAAEDRLDSIEETIKRTIDNSRTERMGPVAIDEARAERMSKQILFGVDMKADPAEIQKIAKQAFLNMDGLNPTALIVARQNLFSRIKELEYAANNFDGLILADKMPTRDNKRAWYYFQIPFGRGVLAGGLTLMLVILPIIIVASQEAVRAVPPSMRHGVLALGGTKWQAIQQVVLPAAIPGICTGSILAMSRAIGEAAPLLLIGAVFINATPGNLFDGFSAMPLQIFNWTGQPNKEFREVAATGIIVLLVILLSFNALAVFIRNKYQKPLS